MTENGLLACRELVKQYRGRRVVDGIDLDLRRGEVVGLLGPNGAGKTTTFRMLVGLVRPQSGSILLHGEDITRLPMHLRARRGMGYLSQESSIFRKMTVEDNLRAIAEVTNLSAPERKQKVEKLLEEMRLTHLARQKAFTLSGGETRRVEIARALVTDPAFMLLDEPFAGIDPITVGELQEAIAGLRGWGLGVLLTDHNVRETLRITDRAYLVYEGQVRLAGTSAELAADPAARAMYLGESFSL